MVFQMMADAARVAHAAGRNDDVKAGELRDRLAVIDRFGAFQQRRVEGAKKIIAILQLLGVFLENGRGLVGKRRIDEDRGAWEPCPAP